MDVEAVVRPVVESAGLELVDAGFTRDGGRRVLRVTVDRDGGIDLEDVSRSSYTLEVSSPGVERPLRSPRDFERRVGEKVKVKTAEPVEGSRTHTGTLVAADEEAITVETEAGHHRIAHGAIASARTVFEWGPSPAPGKGGSR